MNIDRNLRSRTSRLLLALPVAALAFSLAACSGAAAERPTSEELSTGIQKILDDGGIGDQFTEGQVSCIADALLDTSISDEDLANIADGRDVQTSEDAKALVTQEMGSAVTECATQ